MKIGILTIATNKYLEYFEGLLESFVHNYSGNHEIEWFVFTDRLDATKVLSKFNLPFDVKVLPIKGYIFPEASLFRYKIYTEHANILESEVLVHLDADMLIKSEGFLDKVVQASSVAALNFVYHPGFYRPSNLKLFKFYFLNPLFVIRDAKTIIKYGALGAWETNKTSSAFVPRKLREKYFCGGIWFGSNKSIKEMCSALSRNIEIDLLVNFVARWHDESHLNQFAIQNCVHELSSEFCFDPTYPNLKGLQEIVRAVDKSV